jgi:hypothetical protein
MKKKIESIPTDFDKLDVPQGVMFSNIRDEVEKMKNKMEMLKKTIILEDQIWKWRFTFWSTFVSVVIGIGSLVYLGYTKGSCNESFIGTMISTIIFFGYLIYSYYMWSVYFKQYQELKKLGIVN